MTNSSIEDAQKEGHIYRSQYLDAFASIENWADSRAKILNGNLKTTALLSQKLTIIASDVKSENSRFKHPDHIIPLIDKIRAASAVRSHLVHSRMEPGVTKNGGALWLFRNIAHAAQTNSDYDVTWHKQSFEREIKALQNLLKKLEKQCLKDCPEIGSNECNT